MTAASPSAVRTISRTISRRTALTGAVVAAATAASAPVLRGFDPAAATEPARHGVFGYGVASGDPRRDSVIIWTRATPPGRPVAYPGSGLGAPLDVAWEVASDPDFRAVVRRGRVRTAAERDHTVKVDVTGLATYTRYWYRFRAAGHTSPTGVTRTAPDEPGRTHALRFALMSCSDYTSGWFSGYRGLAARHDLDFVLHVGDYLYEYGNGDDQLRDAQPAGEAIDLAGYRLRHALHKADPDLQAAHRAHPFITIFDDHEIANNAWRDGAGNHDPHRESDFRARRNQALRAYLEWMPFRLPSQRIGHRGTRFFRRFSFGELADLAVLETRQNRSRQIDVPPYTEHCGGYVPADDPYVNRRLADPGRHLLEPEQLDWLRTGVTRRKDWHLIGNQVVLSPIRFPGASLGYPEVPRMLNSDQWDGYGADQRALTEHLAAQPSEHGDAVVLTGDIHSSWAMDIPDRAHRGYRSAGVEFVCPSVTSDGFHESMNRALPVADRVSATRAATSRIAAANPWVRFLDGVGHGYTVVDVAPDRVQADWFLTPVPTAAVPDPRTVASVEPRYHASFRTVRGSRRVSPASRPVGSRADEPRGRGALSLR